MHVTFLDREQYAKTHATDREHVSGASSTRFLKARVKVWAPVRRFRPRKFALAVVMDKALPSNLKAMLLGKVPATTFRLAMTPMLKTSTSSLAATTLLNAMARKYCLPPSLVLVLRSQKLVTEDVVLGKTHAHGHGEKQSPKIHAWEHLHAKTMVPRQLASTLATDQVRVETTGWKVSEIILVETMLLAMD
mmetsp:Transcript_20144/g.49411  ORF Transcript_20144/g.49411 Transcript_20144/m.49411 type:complete len:191 (+) Transcript_20144:114-686(+)